MRCSVSIFLAYCAVFAWLALVRPTPNPTWRMIFEFMPYMALTAWIAIWLLQASAIGSCRRAFLQGFVRGVRVSEPGAPKKWTMQVCEETVAAVQAVAAEREMSVARSIELLKKRDPERWRTLSEPRYYEAVRRLGKSAT
jgi:hypothetical protein